MTVQCCDKMKRLQAHRRPNPPNGIDYVEVHYPTSTLVVSLFRTDTVLNDSSIRVVDIKTGYPLSTRKTADEPLTIQLNQAELEEGRGYRLLLVDDADPSQVHARIDPRFSEFEFIYNRSVVSEVDFLKPDTSKQSVFTSPNINYLAKDYASFRQLVLDRLALTMPNWQEAHAADLGMTLVELLAFIADRLSYEQDAVATEAYLTTARRRISVRRHARLVDYRMHEGCNARAFLHLSVIGDFAINPDDVLFTPELPASLQLPSGPLSIGQIPDEVWDRTLAYEPLAQPMGHWRFFRSQAKVDSNLFVNSQSAEDAGESTKIQQLLQERFFTPLRQKLVDLSKDNWTHPEKWEAIELLVNELIETIDLFEFKDLRDSLGTFQSQIGHLPVPYRNRAILDFALPESLSPSLILPRIQLYQAHNEIKLYAWCESQCILSKGATRATLLDCDLSPLHHQQQCPSPNDAQPSRKLHLGAGDFVLFEEVRGPRTGSVADADPTKRHYVRLTSVLQQEDKLTRALILEVEWAAEDALPFDLCVSSRLSSPNCAVIDDVSVARGNVILVDHGRTLAYQSVGQQSGVHVQIDCGTDWDRPNVVVNYAPLRPVLRDLDVTFSQPFITSATAKQAVIQDPSRCIPSVSMLGIPSADGATPVSLDPVLLESNSGSLFESAWSCLTAAERSTIEDLLSADDAYDLSLLSDNKLAPNDAAQRQERCRQLLGLIRDRLSWQCRFDLMGSTSRDQHFVLECDNQRQVRLRFGDDQHGQHPTLGSEMFVRFRIGSGSRGNVGAERITRVVFRRNSGAIVRVRNPLPTQGGSEPESQEQARLLAPHAYRKDQPRALRADDYEALVKAKFVNQVQSVKASIIRKGTYRWVDVVIDPLAAIVDRSDLVDRISRYVNSVSAIGHLVMVQLQNRVPIDLRMTVVVDRLYPLQTVRQAILETLSNGLRRDGSPGFFHPDRLSFGQAIHSNTIIEEVLQVAGVDDAKVTFLGRLDSSVRIPVGRDKWSEFTLQLQPTEIAELDHSGGKDAGRFCLTLEGGR